MLFAAVRLSLSSGRAGHGPRDREPASRLARRGEQLPQGRGERGQGGRVREGAAPVPGGGEAGAGDDVAEALAGNPL